jgi:hypothetical protein
MPDIRGIHVEAGGTYLMLEDVVQSIREYAQSLDDPNAGAAIHDLASWLGASSMPAATAGITAVPTEQHGADEEKIIASLQAAQDLTVYRVELYPDPPEDPRPRWYARSVDADGTILHTTAGSYDYDYVYKQAAERWPDKPIYQLNKWADDSVFLEKMERNTNQTAAPLRDRVSPKRMFA